MAKKLCARRFSTMACIIKKTTTHNGIKPLTTCCNRVLLDLSERRRKKLHISLESVVGTGKLVCIDCVRELGLFDYSLYEIKRKANTSLVTLSFLSEFSVYFDDALTKDLKSELSVGAQQAKSEVLREEKLRAKAKEHAIRQADREVRREDKALAKAKERAIRQAGREARREEKALTKAKERAIRQAEREARREEKALVKAKERAIRQAEKRAKRVRDTTERLYQKELAALSKPLETNIKRMQKLAKRDKAKENSKKALAQIWDLSHSHKSDKCLWHYSMRELENAIESKELYLSTCLMYLKTSHDSFFEETVAQKVTVDYIIYKASYEDLTTKYNLSQNTIRKYIVLGFLHYLDTVYVKPEDISHWPFFTNKLLCAYLRFLVNPATLEFKSDPVNAVQPSKVRLAVEWSKKMKAIRQRNLSS
ncbi:TPA: cell envelope integrity protein TolA [Vibrio parahaemolyticus]|uniref:cell envelope integrity protein TolA n=1 Tax=Vibrio parahaemolyticus TaxID=670 RepID=UPI0011150C5A|nr:cell envelope integrity protein TolA [Vibrio parahaemolyticus]MDG2676090.1 cell envelope integrity protein TolA [Vibrio parahaemolyticus]HCG6385164.1 cell envelope integrity protein TolA [Vibrio parahaemolyticus]HCG9607969.1 cell envelope integrity protein TolA [Vibrio parahaemolyticus]HCG9616911.1 cell envelope integrity protein TolA [Vibrio parahaemolyticus]HCM1387395.1 cell envelope integrity protein TolA [Vibrio parahaemolyticus]